MVLYIIIQIGEREHAEIEQGLMESLHSVQVNKIEMLGLAMLLWNFVHPLFRTNMTSY